MKYLEVAVDWIDYFTQAYPDEMKEIEYISKFSEVPIKTIKTLNLLYELSANKISCSSILIKDKEEYVILIRNLDFAFQ